MTDQPGSLVNHQELVFLGDYFEQICAPGHYFNSCSAGFTPFLNEPKPKFVGW